jgi:hypothetical protein
MRLRPDPLGPQHDEREPGWFRGHFKWNEGLGDVQTEAILHSSALERFAAENGVQHHYERLPYHPSNLKEHSKVRDYYIKEPA